MEKFKGSSSKSSRNYTSNDASNNASNNVSNNGGILGSGIFGMFGSQVVCKGTDDTIYCNFMKIINFIMGIIIICVIIYFIYYVLKIYVFKSKKGK